MSPAKLSSWVQAGNGPNSTARLPGLNSAMRAALDQFAAWVQYRGSHVPRLLTVDDAVAAAAVRTAAPRPAPGPSPGSPTVSDLGSPGVAAAGTDALGSPPRRKAAQLGTVQLAAFTPTGSPLRVGPRGAAAGARKTAGVPVSQRAVLSAAQRRAAAQQTALRPVCPFSGKARSSRTAIKGIGPKAIDPGFQRTASWLEACMVEQLKDLCAADGLSCTGTKETLIQRLMGRGSSCTAAQDQQLPFNAVLHGNAQAAPMPVMVDSGGGGGLGRPGTGVGIPWQQMAAAAGTGGSGGPLLQTHLPMQHAGRAQQQLLTGRAPLPPAMVAYGDGGRLGGPGTSVGVPWQQGHPSGLGAVVAAAAGTGGSGGPLLQTHLPMQHAGRAQQQLLTGRAPLPPAMVAYGDGGRLGGPGTSVGVPWQQGHPSGLGAVVAAAAGTGGSGGPLLQTHLPMQHAGRAQQQLLTGRAPLPPAMAGGGGGLGGPGLGAGLAWQQGDMSGFGWAAATAVGTGGSVGPVQQAHWPVQPTGGTQARPATYQAYNEWEIRQQILGNRRAE